MTDIKIPVQMNHEAGKPGPLHASLAQCMPGAERNMQGSGKGLWGGGPHGMKASAAVSVSDGRRGCAVWNVI